MTTIRTLRSLRKEFALTQSELAGLLAVSQTVVSRIEGDEEPAALETALCLQVIFDVEPHRLFHRRYGRVEDAVMRRAAELDQFLAGRTDLHSARKQRLLAAMVRRARPAKGV